MSQPIKVGLCQINPILGDFDYNYNKILDSYNEAIKHNCDLVVFPEMVVTGYPPQDLLLSDKFIDKNFEKHLKASRKIGDKFILEQEKVNLILIELSISFNNS